LIKFLVVRFSSIGDIVLTSPVVRAIKKQIPESEVHYLTKKNFSFLLKDNPNIDKVFEFDNDFRALVEQLKNESYDYVIDLHNNLRTRRIKNALSIADFTIDKLNFRKWLLVNFKINRLPQKHIVERSLETLSVFDIKNDKVGLDYFFTEKDNYKIDTFVLDVRNGYVAFVIGATYYTKQIPNELSKEIINKSALPFVLLGGKDDVEKAEELTKQIESPVLNLCGKISLNESASVIKQAKLVVSSDTGLMHIAAAFNKPIISLWGNTVPEFGMSPYLPNSLSKIFEIDNLKCRPCSKIGYDKCPKKHFDCMQKLNSSDIAEYLKYAYAQ